MKFLRSSSSAVVAMVLAQSSIAQPATTVAPAPAFEVAYRAWDVVTELARVHGDPAIGGECGKTFRPFVIPGLRRQTKPEEDVSAAACVKAARAACANSGLRKSAEIAKKCEEFR